MHSSPFDHISGQIRIKGRAYSAKEVIRGLLEQGITITENSDGLKIGFKHFSPQSATQEVLDESNITSCPFIPFISQINSRLDNISSRIDLQTDDVTDNHTQSSTPSKSPSSSSFSPFENKFFQNDDLKDKEKFFTSNSSFLNYRQKCSSCGAILPQNAFFCNKCGSHVRSG